MNTLQQQNVNAITSVNDYPS